MIEIKRLEDKEVVFLNKTLTIKEDLEFSQFLKKRKLKISISKKK